MKKAVLAFLSIVALCVTLSRESVAQKSDDDLCSFSGPHEIVIPACTRFLSTKIEKWQRVTALRVRAGAYGEIKKFDLAIADLEDAVNYVEDKEGLADVYRDRSHIHRKAGRLQDALKDIDAALQYGGRSASKLAERSAINFELEKFPDALDDINQAIAISKNPLWVLYSQRFQVFERMGNFRRAVGDLRQVQRQWGVGTKPNQLMVRAIIADMLRRAGEYDQALSEYNGLLQLEPKNASFIGARGEIWRLKGDFKRAEADFGTAIAANPQEFTTLAYRGNLRRQMGNLDAALSDFNEALKLAPTYLYAVTGRGLTYEKLGDMKNARADFQAVISQESKYDRTLEAKETARARLAALDAGAVPDALKPVPVVIPTNVIKIEKDVKPEIEKAFGKRVALIIGNSAYTKVPKLPNPARDAEKIAATLRGLGWQVVVGNDLSREKLLEALTLFSAEAKGADWAVVYYAGHGVEVNGQNYLIPVDAKLSSDRDVGNEAIPLDSVMTAVEGAKKLRLVMLDACRDNPFLPDMKRTQAPGPIAQVDTQGGQVGTRSLGTGLGALTVSGGTLVVYAAKHGQVALDGTGNNSPFALAVANRLATPGVEIYKIFRLVRDDVLEATQGRQEPFNYGSLPGREDYYFVSK